MADFPDRFPLTFDPFEHQPQKTYHYESFFYLLCRHELKGLTLEESGEYICKLIENNKPKPHARCHSFRSLDGIQRDFNRKGMADFWVIYEIEEL